MVYKLFDLRPHGSLGKKIVLAPGDNGEYELRHRDATLLDTMEKIQVLHNLGGHATEIVGLDSMANFLIVKQPLAEPQPYNSVGYPESDAYRLFETDRTTAINAIRGEICRGSGLRVPLVVGFVDEQAWLVADLHHRNIMRDADGNATIIDALTGSVTPSAYQKLPWLADAVARAKGWRHNLQRPKSWSEDFEEDEI
ncbi:MAG: hypothetical protein JWM59_278 [Verrucomicrobiales bacterium]|nr:hypothetical protein [Verrucomicrobiales bacterium]